jgi:hypothetical protein
MVLFEDPEFRELTRTTALAAATQAPMVAFFGSHLCPGGDVPAEWKRLVDECPAIADMLPASQLAQCLQALFRKEFLARSSNLAPACRPRPAAGLGCSGIGTGDRRGRRRERRRPCTGTSWLGHPAVSISTSCHCARPLWPRHERVHAGVLAALRLVALE